MSQDLAAELLERAAELAAGAMSPVPVAWRRRRQQIARPVLAAGTEIWRR